ncbi:ATP synthase subunit I [Marinobacter sp. LV10MA510-1]|uniref:N-ATPase subunit AtpR n=1 Tax=Marinobacter sp. LV10MA510-1 TaxID=1415567 RepID=UPI000BF6A314|nr:ATP synthase subunit I [Marinobacter sp. LV10MA510-1]PFG10328.1 F1F0 ATPase subunit 2 [Marinobacter sp. LV10MA510-1]
MTVDWSAVLLGLTVGVAVSSVFFVGLAWGMKRALRSRQPEALLLLSATVRIIMLLGVGFWLATSSATAWPMAGFALAFLLVRMVVVLWVRNRETITLPEQGGT